MTVRTKRKRAVAKTLSDDDLRRLTETEYLLRSENNARRLLNALLRAKSYGNVQPGWRER